MKKFFLTAAALSASVGAFSQAQDSTRLIEEVSVAGLRAVDTTPVAFSNVKASTIASLDYGQDMPFLLTGTPSLLATSDAGNGVGYTGIRIRGSDPSRINVTLNGVPLNDAESQNVFWVNSPDIASSLSDIQIQRGVGTSTNGGGAFGGSINMRSESAYRAAGGELSGSYGSFNTYRQSLKVYSGMIADRVGVSLRLTNQHSDGYIDRATTDLWSYFAQVNAMLGTWDVKLINYSGNERTYHAWNGIDWQTMQTDRRYNPSGEINGDDGNFTGKFYKDQTDKYHQNSYQLIVAKRLNDRWSMNTVFHCTLGDGYYEEYKNGAGFDRYGLAAFTADGTTYAESNLVRRKQMDNVFSGALATFEYKDRRLDVTQGASANLYRGKHFGRVIWVKNYMGDLDPDHEYYRNRSDKDDAMVFVKASYEAARRLHLVADLQYRYVRHTIRGVNDMWDSAAGALQPLDVVREYNFFNPKGGFFYTFAQNSNIFGSLSVGHREPTRNNFTDADPGRTPRSERMLDYELGYIFKNRSFSATVNLYYMDYKDQIVLTGRANEIGEPIAENVPDSYRAGVEMVVGVQVNPWLRWDANLTLSRNRIRRYTEFVDSYDTGGQASRELKNMEIAYSPSVMAANILSMRFGALDIALQTNYVGSQYMTNSNRSELRLKSYLTSNLRASYRFRVPLLKYVETGLSVNNLLDERYASNGWGDMWLKNGAYEYDAGYFPQAGINFMANLKIMF